jgi:acyl carrier protein
MLTIAGPGGMLVLLYNKNRRIFEMATLEEVYSKVKCVVAERLGVSDDDVTIDASYADDLGADSLDKVELITALEEEFGTDIPDQEAEQLITVRKTIEYILSRME